MSILQTTRDQFPVDAHQAPVAIAAAGQIILDTQDRDAGGGNL